MMHRADEIRSRSATAAVLTTMLAISALAIPATASGQEQGAVGAQEFMDHCAACHGESGRGDGPAAEALGLELPSLTLLAKNNDGKYPFERVFQTIDGRYEVKAHGTLEMPVWGRRYQVGLETYDAPASERTRQRDRIVRGRILELVYFLRTLQEE